MHADGSKPRWWLTKGGVMPATTPEQIHRLFEEAFNAGDLDSLMELYGLCCIC